MSRWPGPGRTTLAGVGACGVVRSPRHGQPSTAHPAEARDEVAGVGAGELDGVFAQAGQALGQVGHTFSVAT